MSELTKESENTICIRFYKSISIKHGFDETIEVGVVET